jgi:secreted trypsin-like serine protease
MSKPRRTVSRLLLGAALLYTVARPAGAIDSDTAASASASVKSWVVGIELRSDAAEEIGERTCTGALIGERHVLTAAHCIVGEHVGHLVVTTADGGRHGVTGVLQHPKFTNGELSSETSGLYDIAILELETAVKGPKPKLAGTGSTKPGAGKGTVHGYTDGRTVSLSLTPAGRTAGRYYTIFNAKEQVAFSGRSGTTCFGDSGAPLTRRSQNGRTTVLAGVLSYGPADCRRGIPVVFTRVERNRKFITSARQQLENTDSAVSWETRFGEGSVEGLLLVSETGKLRLDIDGLPPEDTVMLSVQESEGALRDAVGCVTAEQGVGDGLTLWLDRACLRPASGPITLHVASYRDGTATGMAVLHEIRP